MMPSRLLSCAILSFAISTTAVPAAAAAELREAASREAILRDWTLQDYMAVRLPKRLEREKQEWRDIHLDAPESQLEAPVLANLTCFTARSDGSLERSMIERVLVELDGDGAPLRQQLRELAADDLRETILVGSTSILKLASCGVLGG